MATYRLKKGAVHHVGGKALSGDNGDTVELNADQARLLADKVEPVSFDSTQPSGVGDKPPLVPGDQPPPKNPDGSNASTPDDTEKFVTQVSGTAVQPVASTNTSVLDGTVAEVSDAVSKINSVDELDQLEKAEEDGKGRKGVLDAIDARRDELGG